MSKRLIVNATAILAFVGTTAVQAQTQFIMADRNNDSLYRVRDLNNDGMISDPGEVFLWFSAANAAGTPGLSNPSAQAISNCREAVLGDQGTNLIYRMVDLNNDGDAQDVGESNVFSGPGNAGGLSFGFPTGAAFNNNCVAYITNAGNAAFPIDAIYRLQDLNGDGDAMDNVNGVNEGTLYVADGAFGPGNGPYSPQEIFFDGRVGYLKNSSANLIGIYRFEDVNNNGRADDAGEFTVFWNVSNAAGTPVSAGLPLEIDRRPTMGAAISMYTLQIATGGIDQLVRVMDMNNDGDGQDAGESAIVYSNGDVGFTAVDIVSLRNGDVLLTDNSGIRVLRLHDMDNDGDFLDVGEATFMFAAAGTIAQARQMDALCRRGDVDCNGFVNIDDLFGVIAHWGLVGPCSQFDIDCNAFVNIDDLFAVINNWG
jgi:hypothetical protein